jgi:ligand-binding sensor domain-containing protein
MLDRHRMLSVTIRSGALIALIATSVMALDPRSPTSNFIRSDFTIENGLPSNVVNAIAQTRNGFLWVGTDAGLVRFSERRFIPLNFVRRRDHPASHRSRRRLSASPNRHV